MDKSPELMLGDKVIVYIRSRKEKSVVSTTVTSIAKNNAVWEYNYDTPDPFFYYDVQFIEVKGKWKRLGR